MTEWNLFICNNCGKQQNLPYEQEPTEYTCYDCEMELEHGETLEHIKHLLKEKKESGLTTEEISNEIDKGYHVTQKLLEYLQADCKVEMLFDDEVTFDNRWYLRT